MLIFFASIFFIYISKKKKSNYERNTIVIWDHCNGVLVSALKKHDCQSAPFSLMVFEDHLQRNYNIVTENWLANLRSIVVSL